MTARVIVGDCLAVLPTLALASVDAIVTDPPYGLGFMGKEWDSFHPAAVESEMRRDTRSQKRRQLYGGKESDAPSSAMAAARYDARRDDEFEEFVREAFRRALYVAKPGAHLVAFGSPRRHHRLMCAIEDAGWEIRDCLSWLFGSGFPKSHNGAWGGTALKPGWEPIVLARAPLNGSVSSNHDQHGVGGLNVDACRIDVEDADYARNHSGDRGHAGTREHGEATDMRMGGGSASALGRWPANVVIDEAAAVSIDEQTGELTSGANPTRRQSDKTRNTFGKFPVQETCRPARGADSGGASRFYYCAKASRKERELGLDESFDRKPLNWSSGEQSPGTFQSAGTTRDVRNHHPTVKPIALMRWLVRLVTPIGGTVLDPFAGSGSTGCAAALESRAFIGIELHPEYATIAEARIRACQPAANSPENTAQSPVDIAASVGHLEGK